MDFGIIASWFIGKTHLNGYRLTFNQYSKKRRCGVADIIKEDNSQVWGIIYELTDEDLGKLDRYEGHPKSYRRMVVRVNDEKGKIIEAITYEVVNKKSFIPPSDEYLYIIKKAAEEYDFPEDYKKSLNSINFSL